jgi:thiol:disulfide interchange protein DsbG
MRSLRILVLSLSLSLPLTAFALPPALETLQKQGGVIGQNFPAPDGLTGWVVQIQGRSLIVYTTPSGQYALSGALVDKGGNNLTEQYGNTYIEQPAANKLISQLTGDPTLIDEGDVHAPDLYAYADANCSFCNKLWTELRPYVQSGKVHVHWVMLAFLKESSPGRAAAILASPDRLAALTLDESKFDKEHEEGGIQPLDPIPAALVGAMKAHEAQMAEAGSQGTPLLLYRKGNTWTLGDGMPRDFPAFMSTVNPSIPPTPTH